MGILSELQVEPWTYQRFIDQKSAVSDNTWGKDENLERFGTKMSEIKWHEKPKRFFSPFRQFELYFNWMDDVKDRRTRRIIAAHKFQFYKEISEEEYQKIMTDKSKKIVKTTIFKGLKFDVSKIPTSEHLLANALFSFEGEEVENYEYWVEKGSKEEKEFAKKYGEIIEIERYSVRETNMGHRYYTFYRAKKYANKDYKNINNDSYYCTTMTYQIPSKKDFKRDSERVTEFCLLFAEIDYYKLKKYKNKSQNEMLEILFKALDDAGFPRPTEVIFPRGLHLSWKINPIPAHRYFEWAILQHKIADILGEFGLDKQTMTNKVQLLRLVGTPHTKTEKTVWGRTYTDDRYLFDELLDMHCAEEVKKEKEKRRKNRERYLKQIKSHLQAIEGGNKKKKDKVIIHQDYDKETASEQQVSAIIFTRYVRDLFSLVDLREGKMEGYREFLCFLVRWFSLVIHKGDTYKAEQEMKKMFWSLDINGKYDFEELLVLTGNVHKVYERFLENWRKGYMYKATTLQKHFNITKEEQQQMVTLIDDEERAKRDSLAYNKHYEANKEERLEYFKVKSKAYYEKRRKAEGKLSSAEKKQMRIDDIKEFLGENPEATQRAIAEGIGVSQSTVNRLMKEIS